MHERKRKDVRQFQCTHGLLKELFQAVDVRPVPSLSLHHHAVSAGRKCGKRGQGSKVWGHSAGAMAFNYTAGQFPELHQLTLIVSVPEGKG